MCYDIFYHMAVDFHTPRPVNIYNAPRVSLSGIIWHPRCPSGVSSHTESHPALISPLISPLTHQRQAIRRTCLAIKARLEPGIMRLRSHTLSPQHFAKVISYPARQTHGSQWAEHSGSLVGKKKKKRVEPELGVAPFTCNRLDFIFVQQGRKNKGKGERVRMRVLGLIRM